MNGLALKAFLKKEKNAINHFGLFFPTMFATISKTNPVILVGMATSIDFNTRVLGHSSDRVPGYSDDFFFFTNTAHFACCHV